MKRLIFDIVFILSVFVLPWWITCILAFVGIFVFVHFYEFLAAGIIIYSLYAIPTSPHILSNPVIFALCISLVYIAIQIIRRSIILYRS